MVSLYMTLSFADFTCFIQHLILFQSLSKTKIKSYFEEMVMSRLPWLKKLIGILEMLKIIQFNKIYFTVSDKMTNLTSKILQYVTSPQQAAYLLDFLSKQNYSLDNENQSQILINIIKSLNLQGNDNEITESTPDKVNNILKIYISPLLLVLGTIGNILAFVVLVKNSKKVSTYHYLYVLAIMDILLLMTNLLQVWIKQLTGTFIQNEAYWLCRLFIFLGYFSSDASVWLIIAVTIERWIAVQMPLKTSIICTPRRTKISIVGVLFAIASVNCHFLWSMELQEVRDNSTIKSYVCAPSPVYQILVYNVWPWVDAIIYSFLPFVIISAVNFMIINTVCVARKKRETLLLSTQQKKMETRRANSKLTVMLLSLSFSFLCLTLPMNIMMIAVVFWNKKTHSDEENATFNLMRTVTELLMYTNHTINFMLYFLTGQRFRQQFANIFLPCHPTLSGNNEYERAHVMGHNMKRFHSWSSEKSHDDTSRCTVIRSKNPHTPCGHYV